MTNIRPVSYTHLDVYKRQTEHWVKETNQQQINGVNNKLDQQEAEIKLILQRHEEMDHQLLNEAMEDKPGKIIGVQYKWPIREKMNLNKKLYPIPYKVREQIKGEIDKGVVKI